MSHREDIRIKVKDSEIITTVLVSALYFSGHHLNAQAYMKSSGMVPRMLDKGQFSRQLHRVADLVFELFSQLGQRLKDLAGAANYLLDSFPVPACDNVRIKKRETPGPRGFPG